MPIEQSIDKVVSTVSLNVTTVGSDPRVNYFPSEEFFQVFLDKQSYSLNSNSGSTLVTLPKQLYVDYANLYLDIPYNLYEGFPNLLNRISIRVLPHNFEVNSLYKYISSSVYNFVSEPPTSYTYHSGFAYSYFSSQTALNYLNDEDNLILYWNSSNNKVFEYVPEEVPPELPPPPNGGGSGLKEFWA